MSGWIVVWPRSTGSGDGGLVQQGLLSSHLCDTLNIVATYRACGNDCHSLGILSSLVCDEKLPCK